MGWDTGMGNGMEMEMGWNVPCLDVPGSVGGSFTSGVCRGDTSPGPAPHGGTVTFPSQGPPGGQLRDDQVLAH